MIQMCIIAYNLNIKDRPLDERFAICDCYSRYMASNYGAIYDTISHNLLHQHKHITEGRSSIYLRVNVVRNDGKKRDVGVNRLVLMAWKPLPDSDYSKYEANHIDRNTLNNHLYNLEWLTHLGNVQHYYNSINAEIIYNDDMVRSMCVHLQNGERYEDVCKLIGIPYNDQTSSYLSALKNRRIRTDISSAYVFPNKIRNNAVFTDDEIHFICKCILNGDSSQDILNKLGICFPKGSKERLNILEIIRRIRSKERFTRISDNYF